MRDISINRIMTTDPVTIGPDDAIFKAKELLDSDGIHHLPVIEDGKLVGIVSSSDLLKLHLLDEGGETVAGLTVRQIMAADPVMLASDSDLHDAAEKLSSGAFHALPVVEPDRTLVGIVTSSDLVEHLLQQIPRGDGSVQERALPGSGGRVTDSDVNAALHFARTAVDSGKGNKVAEVMLHLHEQNRLLNEVLKAAELYMRSGHAEREHSVLIKCLNEVQRFGSD